MIADVPRDAFYHGTTRVALRALVVTSALMYKTGYPLCHGRRTYRELLTRRRAHWDCYMRPSGRMLLRVVFRANRRHAAKHR